MRFCAITVILAAFGAAGCVTAPHAVAGDAEITNVVEASLQKHPDLGPPSQLYVTTRDHVVYLSGTADTGLQRETAGSLAMQTPGVKRVVNNISVSH